MIAISTILFVLLALAGLVITASGTLMGFAAGKASAPSEVEGRKGCITALIGIATIIVGIWGLL